MGKYMRKGKGAGEVAVMEVSQGSMGVRTRARTLALQRDLKGSSTPMPAATKSSKICIEPLQTTSYLELRSRRLEKVSRCYTAAAGGAEGGREQPGGLRKSDLHSNDLQAKILRDDELAHQSKFLVSEEPNRSSKQSMSEVGMSDRSSRRSRRVPSAAGNNSASFSRGRSKVKSGRKEVKRWLRSSRVIETQDSVPQNSSRLQAGQAQGFEEETPLEASFGENVIDHESRERHIRETTPSSLIGDGEALEPPGSTTRASNATSGRRRMQNEGRRNVPTSREMEDFFAGAEQQQQRLFTERYNYDPVNDLPLPGRYEWVRLRP